MAGHRITMTADFSQADSEIKKMISNMRFMGNAANGSIGFMNQGVASFIKSLQDVNSKAVTTKERISVMNTLLKEEEMLFNRLEPKAKEMYGAGLQKAIDNATKKIKGYNDELNKVGLADGGVMGNGKSLFKGILGGNLAARLVMDTMRFVGKTIKDAVKDNAEFEYSQATLAAVLGKSKQEIMDLTIQAKKLGSTSLYSAKEISELQVVLARLGFTMEEIKDSTDPIAKLALATGVSLDRAAELTGATMRAFAYDTKEAARVAAVLGVSTTKSALDMEKLRTAMSYASSSASAAGFEIEEVVAMLGKMVDRGQQATTAGVNIRNIMLDLNSASSKLRKAIKIATGRDNIRGFEDLIEALREMRDAGINLDDVAATIQRRVTPGFLNLLANTEGVHDLAQELRGCTEELDKMAEKMEDTLSGASKKLGNSWNALMLSFSNSNKGVLKNTLTMLDKIVDSWTRMNNLRVGSNMAVAESEKGADKESVKRQIEYNESWLKNKSGEELDKALDGIVSDLDKAIKGNVDKIKEWSKLLEYWSKRSELNVKRKKGDLSEDEFGKQLRNLESEYGTQIANLFNKQYKNKVMDDGSKLFTGEGRKFLYDKSEEGAWYNLNRLIAKFKDENATLELIRNHYRPEEAIGANGESIAGNAGLGLAEKLNGSKDTVDTALKNYALAVNEAKMEYEAGMIDKKQYDQKILNAMESVYKAYGTAAYAIADPKLKKELTDALNDEQTYLDRQFQTGRITQEEYDKQVQELTNKYADLSRILENSDYKQQFAAWAKKVENQASVVASDDRIEDVVKAQQKYEQAINKATMEKEAGVIDEVGFAKAQLAAQEQLTKVYEDLALETNSEEWGQVFRAAVENTKQFAETLARLTEEANQLKDQKGLNMRILRGLQGYAKQAGVSFESVGLSGKKEAINAMQLGDTIDWSGAVDSLNQYLAKKNFQIAVDIETGSIEKIKDQLEEALDNFKGKLGAVKTLVNFPNELKQAFEGLANTMRDGASAWDTMFAVFNTGFTVLESIASIMEAINTLQKLGNGLTLASAAAKEIETASTIKQSGANVLQASTAGAAAAAEGGKAVSGIPIVGPILAVAAIAAIAAAIAAAFSKTEYHANGGFVGMNGITPFKPMGTDVVPAMLTPGEYVMSRQEVAAANQMAGAGLRSQTIIVKGEVSGRALRMVMDNDNRAAGGSRGLYARTH